MEEYERISQLRATAVEAVLQCVTRREYEPLARAFDEVRAKCAIESSAAVSSLLWDVDRWQGDAALFTSQWEEAWRFRHVGLCQSNRRITVDDVLTVRSRCLDTSLSGNDIHLILLGDNGLTPFGTQRLAEITRRLQRRLNSSHTEHGQNFIERLVENYDKETLSTDDFKRLAAETGHRVMPDSLQRLHESSFGDFSFRSDFYEIEGVQHLNPLKWRQLFSNVFDIPSGLNGPEFRDGYNHPFVEVHRPPMHIDRAVPAICKHWMREAENEVRESQGLPKTGEGWVSESELHQLVAKSFTATTVLQHAQPQWLRPQHIDTYLPEYNIGIEYQGRQHDEPIEYFGGEAAFKEQQRRDRRKKRLCRQNGCVLIEVREGYESEDLVAEIEGLIAQRSSA